MAYTPKPENASQSSGISPRNSWEGQFKDSPETAEIPPLQAKLSPILKQAWKGGSPNDISFLTADLAGLWEVSRVHIKLVNKLIKMKRRPNRKALQQLLIDIEINWFSAAPGHLKTMKGEIGRLRKSLWTD